jgi:hypothetical protein
MSAWQEDAREFGRFVRQGGWRLGLLCARSVGAGPGKVSVAQFSIEARIGTSTISLYLRAWELAADENLVPHADGLEPGSEPVLDTTTLPDWRRFYRSERQMAGRGSSVELHPDPQVMQRRLRDRPDTAEQIVSAIEKGLPDAHAADLAERLSQRVEREHIPPPSPPRDRPVFVVVDSVQRVIDALELVRAEADRLPPVMTTNSKTLLTRAAMATLPVVEDLAGLARDIPVGASR